jgi:hypothetical protein
MTTPRLMSGADAAAYLGVTPATFAKWVADGRAPKPLPGCRRWDRKAIDLALDSRSGIVAPSATDPDDVLEKWIREDAARKTASGTGNRQQAAR